MILRARDVSIVLDRPVVMGILNVTPDSFSDGGLWLDPQRAIDHALEMVADGAGIIDVGGESTRPGAEPVPAEEELRRVLPVIENLVRETDVPLSIDTRKPSVAEAAIDAGATIVNDTSGEQLDPDMDKIIASTGAAIIIMHSRGTPATMRELTQYGDIVANVVAFLQRRADELQSIGVARDAIAIDPGFGFAKDAGQSLTMLRRFEEFVALGYPVLAGTSRKSFIGAVLDTNEADRLEGTAVTVGLAVAKGARIVRVHDVREMSRVVRMATAVIDPDNA